MRVYHASRIAKPPHEAWFASQDDYRKRKETHGMNHNMHPDIIHAGTEASALEIGGGSRKYMHTYDVDVREISPVTYDDAVAMRETDEFKQKLSGAQQSLWESIPSTGVETLQHGRVQPYRNKAEDAGSISYMIPKSAINAGHVKYTGVSEINRENK